MEDRLKQLSKRANRAFLASTPTEVIGSRKAIVGPRRLDLLVADAENARKILAQGGTPSPIEIAALEQAIRLQRPAPACKSDGLTPLPLEGNWLAEKWNSFQPILKRIQGSIARLERIDDPDPGLGTGRSSWGTGFLVAPGILMTAAHVVDELSFSTRTLERGQAMAEFEGYYGATSSKAHEIVEVLAYDGDLDLALLRIDPPVSDNETRPVLLTEVSQPVTGEPICVIGYPLEDVRSLSDLRSIVFGNRFGVKRAAIGEIIDTAESVFYHDCSTLGGNSGSPVIDLNSGQVCGVHVSGKAMMSNGAVFGSAAREFLDSMTTVSSPNINLPRKNRMKNPKANFDDYFLELQKNDSQVSAEIGGALDEAATAESTEGHSNPFIRETIVLTKGRPVLDIKDNTTVIDFNEVESEIWRQRLTNATGLLARHIPAVGRIELANHPRGVEWLGTGWLLKDNVVVTNRHVAEIFGEANGGEFTFRPGFDGSSMQSNIDFLEEFDSDSSHEFPLFKIMHIERGGGPDLAFLRIEPMNGQQLPKPISLVSAPVKEGEHVAVIGYPAKDEFFPDQDLMRRIFNDRYDKKRLAPGLITGKTTERIFHDCTTLGGNSGAELVSLETGNPVALHFAGTLFTKNHAVPIEVVAETLDDVLAGRNGHSTTPRRSGSEVPSQQSVPVVNSRVVEATIPIKVRVEIGDVIDSASGSVPVTPQGRTPVIDLNADDDLIETTEARPEDYKERKGYLPGFLGEGFEVPMPEMTAYQSDSLPYAFNGEKRNILHYHHFSVLMSKSRRMCRFSACNINGKKSKSTNRTGWRFDPRVPKSAQIMKECYGNLPKFSRGHMTRREDPAWGGDADLGNRDSMHVTNTVPQIQPFNGVVWLALENYALQNARKDDMKISVFTGPFLADSDPIRYGVKIPLVFWKVIAFIHDDTGKLCATGYTMSQKSFIGEEEFVFGRHETNQRPISEIERRAGISFGPLAELDPLKKLEETAITLLTHQSQIRFT